MRMAPCPIAGQETVTTGLTPVESRLPGYQQQQESIGSVPSIRQRNTRSPAWAKRSVSQNRQLWLSTGNRPGRGRRSMRWLGSRLLLGNAKPSASEPPMSPPGNRGDHDNTPPKQPSAYARFVQEVRSDRLPSGNGPVGQREWVLEPVGRPHTECVAILLQVRVPRAPERSYGTDTHP